MKVIVVGGGKVGRTITGQLAYEGHDVAVIDDQARVITEVTDSYDVMGIVGNGASYTTLQEAGVDQADLLIAATNADEVNLLCCLFARKAGVVSTIARVRNPVYNQEVQYIKKELGLSMVVNPERAAATEAARILRFPSAINIDTFARGRVEILKFEIPEGSPIQNCSLMDIAKGGKAEVLVCAVQRGGEAVIPNGRFVLKAHDMVSIVASPDHARRFFEEIRLKTNSVRSCMIIGGGTIAYYLAEQLINEGIETTIIEENMDRCEELSVLLPKATIINGDATNQDVLLEEGIRDVEAVVTLTGIDEENVFLSLFARNVSNAKIITKIDRINYDDVIKSLNLGSLLHPKNITAQYITRYARAMQNSIGSNMESLYSLIENQVEAMEFIIRSDSPVVGVPLAQLPVKDGVLIACISRKGQTIIPNGHSLIEPDDSVIVVTTLKGCNDIGDILKEG